MGADRGEPSESLATLPRRARPDAVEATQLVIPLTSSNGEPRHQPGGPTPLLIVDGHNLLWGATFGFPAPIYSRDKTRRLTGLFAFFALLRKTIQAEFADHPPEVVVIFDGRHGADTRKETFAGYKAGRPDDTAALEPLTYLADTMRGLDRHGIAWVEIDNQEADDLVASLTATQRTRRPVVILSRDRDFYQLIGDGVTVLNNGMRPGHRFVTEASVTATYGVTPTQWVDYRALTGDPADDIPGIKGIGAKTAVELLHGGHTLETIPPERTSTGRGRAVREHLDQAFRWRALIQLNADVDLDGVTITGSPTPPLPTPADMVEALGLW